jgi:hypothetical protein
VQGGSEDGAAGWDIFFDLAYDISGEGMFSSEYVFQATQATTRHAAPEASADTDTNPNGRDTISTAGLKVNARTSKAALR